MGVDAGVMSLVRLAYFAISLAVKLAWGITKLAFKAAVWLGKQAVHGVQYFMNRSGEKKRSTSEKADEGKENSSYKWSEEEKKEMEAVIRKNFEHANYQELQYALKLYEEEYPESSSVKPNPLFKEILTEMMAERLKSENQSKPLEQEQFHADKMMQSSVAAALATERKIKNYKEQVFSEIKKGMSLGDLPEDVRYLRADKDILLAAVSQNGWELAFGSDQLKNDKDIVLSAVQETGTALQYASLELRNDKQMVIAAVRENGFALQFASPALRSDRDVVQAAFEQNEKAIKYASKELRSDKAFVQENSNEDVGYSALASMKAKGTSSDRNNSDMAKKQER